MAKIKKRTLRWTASQSPQVVGYKLYWSEGGQVTYDSPSTKLGNATEVVLPDDVEAFTPQSGPIELGITAVDELGNESDIVTVSAPYQFNVPQAPEEIWLEGPESSFSAEFVEQAPEPQVEESEPGPFSFLEQDFEEEPEVRAECIGDIAAGKDGYDDSHNILVATDGESQNPPNHRRR